MGWSVLRSKAFAIVSCALALAGCAAREMPHEEIAEDEAARRAHCEGRSLKEAAELYYYPRYIHDYFQDMDTIADPPQETSPPDQLIDLRPAASDAAASAEAAKALAKKPTLAENEYFGRNTWMMWCGGNEAFWDSLSQQPVAFIDLLKMLDSRNRRERFKDRGVINEPQMTQAGGPDRLGLWLDVPTDPKIQAWRYDYVDQTFRKLIKGVHKTQRGLKTKCGEETKSDGKKKPTDGGAYDSPDVYVRAAKNGHRDYGGQAASEYGQDQQDHSGDDSYGDYKNIPPPDIYGISSGVVGLRLFPNPNFDAEAQRRWNGQRYYADKTYYEDPKLVRPYRVGVACAYCHASFHPLRPPRDVTNPEWRNISGNIGAQYLNIRAAFGNLLEPNNFVYHLLESQPPGTIDTSLIASDNINNPNAMNAIFRLPERAVLSFRNPPEVISQANRMQPTLWKDPRAEPNEKESEDKKKPQAEKVDPVPQAFVDAFQQAGLLDRVRASNEADRRYTPRVLFDGADSFGAWGALARVYLNIGSYYERWDQLHEQLIGFKSQRPFRIEDCQNHSVNWNATQLRVPGLRDYFLKISPAMPLLSTENAATRLRRTYASANPAAKDEKPQPSAAADVTAPKPEPLSVSTPDRARHLDVSKLERGRRAFANNCIVCHSSIQPETSQGIHEAPPTLIEERKNVREKWADRGEFWEHNPGQWFATPEYVTWAEAIVTKPEFWQRNYLSTDYRIPVNVVGTNSGRAMATNAVTGHMWEDFASISYRSMPSVGTIPYFDIYRNKQSRYSPQHKVPEGVPTGGGGPGFYRVPSLVSIWTTAPLLHNNTLGLYNRDPSVNGRLDAFDDAMRKMLWPETRVASSSFNGATPDRLERDGGLVWRTTEESYLIVGSKYVPTALGKIPYVADLARLFPWLLDVYPLWLPSLVLLLTGFVLLLLANPRRRRLWIYLWLFVNLVLLLAWYLAPHYSQTAIGHWLRTVKPIGLLIAVLFVPPLVILLPVFGNSWKATRGVGYIAILLALGMGGLVYYNAGSLGDITLGPIPKGTPVNLIANTNSEAGDQALKKAVLTTVAGLGQIESARLEGEPREKVMREQIAPALLEVSKCPDFVMDRGHYFEWFKTMSDEDKDALIELLKTF